MIMQNLEKVFESVCCGTAMMTKVSQAIVAAYEATEFRVLEPLPFTLRVGCASEDLLALYTSTCVNCAAFLTAWNPYSLEISDKDNKKSQEALLRYLSLEGYPTLNALGVDPTGTWPGEESLFVPGLSLERAKALGADFGQNAIVWVGDDAVPQLILLV